ncbi:MAG: regulator SirB [Lysobacterales bacterium 69-70]|nr:SirB2 family protein [Xanthomonadaceae bacterium]ODU31548.1 MAG: regulator SirB [Xanthomonadaceae bacterium SCN 69-320]ODV16684.1 MAG: regulator SirB [Xanthomonadaceae bacterium SCN 69-25]OJY96880.1 MAG: regulator SirB [Xanthomonadales bacterium 69-70]
MVEFYLQIKFVHIAAVIASGSLFGLRGLLMLAGSPWSQHALLRYMSYAIDTTLLTAALMLTTIIRQYPGAQSWLTVKVLCLVVYIVLGTFALKRGRTYRARLACFIAAITVYLFIVSVARAHSPWGWFA